MWLKDDILEQAIAMNNDVSKHVCFLHYITVQLGSYLSFVENAVSV